MNPVEIFFLRYSGKLSIYQEKCYKNEIEIKDHKYVCRCLKIEQGILPWVSGNGSHLLWISDFIIL